MQQSSPCPTAYIYFCYFILFWNHERYAEPYTLGKFDTSRVLLVPPHPSLSMKPPILLLRCMSSLSFVFVARDNIRRRYTYVNLVTFGISRYCWS